MSDSVHESADPREHGPYRAVVAEDEPLIRQSIASKIDEAECGFRVVGTAGDGDTALSLVGSAAADLLVTDIRMPGVDGLTLIRRIAQSHPGVHTLIVSGHDEFDYARSAIRHGVSDYLLKPVDADELRDVLVRIRTDLDRERERQRNLYHELRNARLPSEAANELKTFISNHYIERLDIRRAAEALNINYSSVGRLFKRFYGMSPLKYAMTLRVERAKQLLVEVPQIDIRTVAEMVGYEDQGYFTRMFRAHTGVAPSEYRERR